MLFPFGASLVACVIYSSAGIVLAAVSYVALRRGMARRLAPLIAIVAALLSLSVVNLVATHQFDIRPLQVLCGCLVGAAIGGLVSLAVVNWVCRKLASGEGK